VPVFGYGQLSFERVGVMAKTQALAIRSEGEAALAEHRRRWRRKPKPVPTKTRHLVEMEAPIVPYRPGEAPHANYLATVAEDLSAERLEEAAEDQQVKSMLWLWLGVTTLGAVIGTVALGPLGVFFGAYVGLAVGLPAIGFPCILLPNKRHIRKVLAGRLDESAEIAVGVENLGFMANGVDVFGANVVRLPVESLFRALGHDDPDVRQFASELIAKLPEQVRTDAVVAFAKHLTAEQLAMVPDCSLPPTLATMHDENRVEWPEKLVTMTKSDSE